MVAAAGVGGFGGSGICPAGRVSTGASAPPEFICSIMSCSAIWGLVYLLRRIKGFYSYCANIHRPKIKKPRYCKASNYLLCISANSNFWLFLTPHSLKCSARADIPSGPEFDLSLRVAE